MFSLKTILFGAVAIAAATACDQDRQDTSSRTAPYSPSPSAPITQEPSAGGTVTLTGGVANVGPLAKAANRDEVKELPDEVRIDPEKEARIASGFQAPVRSAPDGDVISTIDPADHATEIARDPKGDHYLVIFPDPKDASKKLAGWVFRDAVENDSWATTPAASNEGASKLACGKGEVHLRTDHDFCGKSCKDDSVCNRAAGELCDGLAFEVHETLKHRSNVRYCIADGSSSSRTRGTNAK
jgi:hypothetical protein